MRAASLLKFFPPPRYLTMPALGLDLSDRSLKFCSFARRGSKLTLARWGECELPEGAIVNGELKAPELVQEALAKVQKETGESFAALALPEEPSYTVRLNLPALRPVELRGAVELALGEHVPLEAGEMVFDYEIVHGRPGQSGYELAVTAIPQAVARGYRSLFNETGLTPLALETEAAALARALAPEAGTVALVDLGRWHVGLVIASGGVVLRTSTISEIGGRGMTRSLERGLSLSAEEAESLKQTVGLLESADERVLFSLLPTISVLREEINRFIASWQGGEGAGGRPVERVLITGGEAALPGLVTYLASGLKLPVGRGCLPAGVELGVASTPPFAEANFDRFTVAFGSALRAWRPRLS